MAQNWAIDKDILKRDYPWQPKIRLLTFPLQVEKDRILKFQKSLLVAQKCSTNPFSEMCAVVQFCTFATSGDVFDRPYDWNQSSLIIPSRFTTQMDMLKSDENNNRAANPPGYLLSDIKRRSLSSLLDRIPRKKEPCYSCLSGRALLLL